MAHGPASSRSASTEELRITETSTPNLGQPVTFALPNVSGPMVIAVGFPTVPFTACGTLQIGIDLVQSPLFFYTPILPLVVPCNPALVGGVLAVQGADLGGTACNNIRVSDAVWVRIL